MTFRTPFDGQRRSPSFRQVDSTRPYPQLETRIPRESTLLGTLEVLPEDNASTPGRSVPDNSAPLFAPQQHARTPFATAPVNGSFVPPMSSSPVSSSSINSSSDHAQSFEAQIKASPMVHDLLDRLIRCEYTTRDIQQNLVDLNRKVNVLLERSLANNSPLPAQPEFKDPFSGNALRRGSYNQLPGGAHLGPRPSIGNIAPNQTPPNDDITTISQRLNTLTSSVGQLLALQTQQAQAPALTPISGLPNMSHNGIMGSKSHTPPSLDFGPPSGALSRGLPNRPDIRPSPRLPNPPMRTWSTGNIDLPVRPLDNVGRGDNFLGIRPPPDGNLGRPDGFPRDKRRSVSGLMRRDSASVRLMFRRAKPV